MLLALGCTLWLAGILVLVYNEFERGQRDQPTFAADLLFFLHTVPFMASLALMPHARKMRETLRFGLIDLLLLAVLWLYVYIFAAMPWKIVAPDRALFYSRDLSQLRDRKPGGGDRIWRAFLSDARLVAQGVRAPVWRILAVCGGDVPGGLCVARGTCCISEA